MGLRYEGFIIVGEANKTIFDPGIESNQAEPKKLVALLVCLSGYAANQVQVWRENERLAGVYDYHLDTYADLGAANFPYSTTKLTRIDLEADIPMGQRVKAALKCGGTLKTMYGCYVYEVAE